jgi:hypothetical protein
MFDIKNSRDFYQKLLRDFDHFYAQVIAVHSIDLSADGLRVAAVR